MDWFPTFRMLLTDGWIPTLGLPWRTTVAQQQALLRLIAVSREEHVSPALLLKQWAEDESGLQRYRLRRLVKLLEEGRSLADAAEAVPGVLRDEDLLALRFDLQSGTRTAAVRANLAKTSAADSETGSNVPHASFYFATVLPIGIAIILFAQALILPKMQRIFADFGVRPPFGMTLSTEIANPYMKWLLIAVVGGLLFWLWLSASRTGRRIRRATAARLFRSVHETRAAEVLQYLSVAVNAGRPLPSALSTLARYHFDPAVRNELLVVRNDVEQGAVVWNSMAEVGLLSSPEAEVLRIAERQGSPAWALGELAEVKRTRVARRRERAGEFLLPVVVLLLASLVIFQALAVFTPTITLIEALL